MAEQAIDKGSGYNGFVCCLAGSQCKKYSYARNDLFQGWLFRKIYGAMGRLDWISGANTELRIDIS